MLHTNLHIFTTFLSQSECYTTHVNNFMITATSYRIPLETFNGRKHLRYPRAYKLCIEKGTLLNRSFRILLFKLSVCCNCTGLFNIFNGVDFGTNPCNVFSRVFR